MQRPTRPFFCLALLLFLGLHAPSGRAQPRDPTLQWRTVRTPHFRVHYHPPLALVARRVAQVAERAHATLTTVFGSEPATPVHIALTDESDSANGSATALPYNTVRLYAEPPDDLSPLAEYDDWMTTLVTHEYTHVVQLDQAYGIATVLNALLGRVYMPNHVQPRWVLEGFAVFEETEHTSGGRLRSTQWDMYLRMDALEDRMWDLDQVSNSADRWPHGNAPYLYGSFFTKFIAERYGRAALATIAREYAGSVLPYGLNRVAHRATGKTFVDLYEEWREERKAHYLRVLEAVERIGRREGERLTHHGEFARAPRWNPLGELFYQRADNRSRPRLVEYRRSSRREGETLERMNTGGEVAFTPDGRSYVHSRIDNHRDIYFYADLFLRDRITGNETRLTQGLRAREPDISRDGRKLVFTTTRAGTTRLMIAELSNVRGTMRELAHGERFELFYTPRFSPDGRTVAASMWRSGGFRDVVLIDVESGAITPLTSDRAQDTGPVFSPDGRHLYFSSDRTGIANIYSFELGTGALRQVTNVIGGAYQPAISPDGEELVYVGYSSYGFDLFAMSVDPGGFRDAITSGDDRPPTSESSSLYSAQSEEYDPFPTLYPRSYMLDVAPDTFGPAVGVSVAGEDVLNFHSWSARAGIGLVRGNLSIDSAYSYNRLPLGIRASGFRHVTRAGGLWIDDEERTWIAESFGGDVGVSYTFPRSFHRHTLSTSYALTRTQPAEPLYVGEFQPDTAPPQRPEYGLYATLRFAWNYSDIERYVYDVSASNGRTLGVGFTISDPTLGSQFRVVTASWGLTQYLPVAPQHVVAFRYAGGISAGDIGRRGLFGVGGFPEVALIEGFSQPTVLGGAALRGYPANIAVGTQYHLVQLEYRMPIYRINHGVFTLPVFLNRLWATAFCDAGDAFFDQLSFPRVRVGVGAELHLDFTLFYVLGFSLRLGYARGLHTDGIDQVYGHLGVPF